MARTTNNTNQPAVSAVLTSCHPVACGFVFAGRYVLFTALRIQLPL